MVIIKTDSSSAPTITKWQNGSSVNSSAISSSHAGTSLCGNSVIKDSMLRQASDSSHALHFP